MQMIKTKTSRVLVLDCLRGRYSSSQRELLPTTRFYIVGSSHASHFGTEDALDATREINAFKTYYVGFGHRMDHYDTESSLKLLESTDGLRVAPAFDGLCLHLETKDRIVESSHFSDSVTIQ